jgi:hypothetical protein
VPAIRIASSPGSEQLLEVLPGLQVQMEPGRGPQAFDFDGEVAIVAGAGSRLDGNTKHFDAT